MEQASPGGPAQESAVIRIYLACTAIYFVGVAFNNILIPWIVSHELGLGPKHLGLAQGALILPMAGLVVFGGRLADRLERRRLLAASFALIAIPPIALGCAALSGALSYPVLIAALVGIALVGSVLNPTRDALLSRAAGGQVQSLVAKAAAVQYGVQIVGYLLAATLDLLSAGIVLIAQGAIWLLGALVALRLPDDRSPQYRDPRDAPSAADASLARDRARIRPILILAAALSASGMGAMLVVVPLLVLTTHGDGAVALTAANVCFTIGTIAASSAIIRRGGIARGQGRLAVIVGLAMSGVIALLAFAPSLLALYILLLAMGALAAILAILLRGLVQGWADPARRGRTLSVYNLAMLGGGPLGAVGLGFVAQGVSLQAAGAAAGGLLLVMLVLLCLTTPIWRASLADE